MSARSAVRHHFTVDVEEHFQVLALAPYVSRDSWPSLASRVAGNVDRLLQLLADHDALGTFFVLGWVAERQPEMVKRIAAAGHEVASHGYDHRRVTELTPAEFREQVHRTRGILEGLTGTPCIGFRAPSYSIVRGTEWALDILVETGHHYDSSLFPVRRPGYGFAGGLRGPHVLRRDAGPLVELPPATLRVAGVNLPAAGGAYFRVLPDVLVRAALRGAARRGEPGMFYIHPWEIDPGQPRVTVPLLTRLRHYAGLRTAHARLARLLADFRFTSVAGSAVLPALLGERRPTAAGS